MDYVEEQTSEIEALESIYEGDLEGEPNGLVFNGFLLSIFLLNQPKSY